MFQKYRVVFRLDKCDFLKDIIEYVGHDIIAQVNCPAQSKFDLIKNWELPKNGQAIFSFIGLVKFYHRCAPYFDIRIFYRKPIAIMAWTPEIVTLLHELKVGVAYYPFLTIFDPDKPTLLKTDWRA